MGNDGLIDTVVGTEEEAFERAFYYADILRKKFDMDALAVKVKASGWRTFYLYVVKA